jgi:hypothetical protein
MALPLKRNCIEIEVFLGQKVTCRMLFKKRKERNSVANSRDLATMIRDDVHYVLGKKWNMSYWNARKQNMAETN